MTCCKSSCVLLVALAVGLLGVGVNYLAGLQDAPEENLFDWSTEPPAWWLYSPLVVLRDTLIRLADLLVPPPVKLMEISQGLWRERLLYIATKLKFADIVATGPKTAAQIAEASGCKSADVVYRVMRALTTFGVFTEVEPKVFRNNRVSSALRRDHPNGLWAMVQMLGNEHAQIYTHAMDYMVQTGQRGDVKVLGKTFWQDMKATPEKDALFSAAMAAIDGLGLAALVEDHNWGQYKRVLDIGGSSGSVLAGILKRYSGPTGVLFDQPQVIDIARKAWAAKFAPLASRVELVGGDFFVSVPEAKDGDAYFLRVVIHDWDDADTVKIFSTIRRAIGDKQATLVLMEAALPEKATTLDNPQAMIDVHMLQIAGMERTPSQFAKLFEQSGFSFVGRSASRSPFSFIVAKPVAAK